MKAHALCAGDGGMESMIGHSYSIPSNESPKEGTTVEDHING